MSVQYQMVSMAQMGMKRQDPPMMMDTAAKCKGTCKTFDASKGYGFITLQDGAGDVFVHYSAIECAGFKSLAKGEPVEFCIAVMADGRKKAVSVTGPNGANVKGQKKKEQSTKEQSTKEQSTKEQKMSLNTMVPQYHVNAGGGNGTGHGFFGGGFGMGGVGVMGGAPVYGGHAPPQPTPYGAPYAAGYGGYPGGYGGGYGGGYQYVPAAQYGGYPHGGYGGAPATQFAQGGFNQYASHGGNGGGYGGASATRFPQSGFNQYAAQSPAQHFGGGASPQSFGAPRSFDAAPQFGGGAPFDPQMAQMPMQC